MTNLRSRRWVAAGLVLLALAASACGVKAPILAVDGLKVGDMGITGVALDVRFRVRNPNPEPLNIDRMEYELFVNGNRLGRGFDSKGLPLEGFGEGKVQSRVDVNFLSPARRHQGRAAPGPGEGAGQGELLHVGPLRQQAPRLRRRRRSQPARSLMRATLAVLAAALAAALFDAVRRRGGRGLDVALRRQDARRLEGLGEPGFLPGRGRHDRLRRTEGPPLLRGHRTGRPPSRTSRRRRR